MFPSFPTAPSSLLAAKACPGAQSTSATDYLDQSPVAALSPLLVCSRFTMSHRPSGKMNQGTLGPLSILIRFPYFYSLNPPLPARSLSRNGSREITLACGTTRFRGRLRKLQVTSAPVLPSSVTLSSLSIISCVSFRLGKPEAAAVKECQRGAPSTMPTSQGAIHHAATIHV